MPKVATLYRSPDIVSLTTADPIYDLLAAAIDQAKQDVDKKLHQCNYGPLHSARDCAIYMLIGLSTFVLGTANIDANDIGTEWMRLANANA